MFVKAEGPQRLEKGGCSVRREVCGAARGGENGESRACARSAGCTWKLAVVPVLGGNSCEKEAFGIHSRALQCLILSSALQML